MEANRKEHRILLREALRDAQKLVEKLAPVRAGNCAPEVAAGKLRDARELVDTLQRYPFGDIAVAFVAAPEPPEAAPEPAVAPPAPETPKPTEKAPDKTDEKTDDKSNRKAEPKRGQQPRVR